MMMRNGWLLTVVLLGSAALAGLVVAQGTPEDSASKSFTPDEEKALNAAIAQIDKPQQLEGMKPAELQAVIAEKQRQWVLALRRQYQVALSMFEVGAGSTEALTNAMTALAEAELSIATTRAARLEALNRALAAARMMESLTNQKRLVGAIGALQFHETCAERLSWEIRLAEELLKPAP